MEINNKDNKYIMEQLTEYTEDLNEAVYENNILRGVKILGRFSQNKTNGKNREYLPTTLQESARIFENSAVYVDHDNVKPKNRKYEERLGYLKNVSFREDNLYADLHTNPKHRLSEQLAWDFINNSKGVGMSIQANGDVKEGKVIKITEVISVDLVTNPATTQSLKEDIDVIDLKPLVTEDKLQEEVIKLTKLIEDVVNKNKVLTEEVEQLKKPKVRSVVVAPTLEPPKEIDIKGWVKGLRKL